LAVDISQFDFIFAQRSNGAVSTLPGTRPRPSNAALTNDESAAQKLAGRLCAADGRSLRPRSTGYKRTTDRRPLNASVSNKQRKKLTTDSAQDQSTRSSEKLPAAIVENSNFTVARESNHSNGSPASPPAQCTVGTVSDGVDGDDAVVKDNYASNHGTVLGVTESWLSCQAVLTNGGTVHTVAQKLSARLRNFGACPRTRNSAAAGRRSRCCASFEHSGVPVRNLRLRSTNDTDRTHSNASVKLTKGKDRADSVPSLCTQAESTQKHDCCCVESLPVTAAQSEVHRRCLFTDIRV